MARALCEEVSIGPSKVENGKVEPVGPSSDTKLLRKQEEKEVGSQGAVARRGLEVGKFSEVVKPLTQALPLLSTAMELGSSKMVEMVEVEPPR